jgi:hypothetical protein
VFDVYALVLSCLCSIDLICVHSEVNAALLQRLRDNDSTLTNLKVIDYPPRIFIADTTFLYVLCALFYTRNAHHPYTGQITKVIYKLSLAEEFFSALAEHQHLERLDLDCVGLGMDLGTKFCRDVLRRMPKLKILDLKVGRIFPLP